MVLIIIGLVFGIGMLVWIWKVPVSKTVNSLKEEGSSTFEAYLVVMLFFIVTIITVYLLIRIL